MRRRGEGVLWRRGSFTIEAALIFPVVLGAIVAVVYMAFCSHDRAVLTQAAYTAAFRGGRQIKNGEEQMRMTADVSCRDLIKGRLLVVRQVEGKAAVDNGRVTVSYQGKWTIPGGVLANKLLSQSRFDMEVTQSALGKDPVDFIRGVRRIRELRDKVREEGDR